MKIISKKKYKNKREIFLFNIKILSYKKTNLKFYIKKYIKAKTLFYFSKCFSQTKKYHIDIVIPTTTKDIHKLSKVIPSFSNIQHHIDNIFVVSPKSEYVLNFCKENNLTFINEDTVLPITLKDINYSPNGVSRSGWIFQQLLKLNIDTFCKNEHILVADSDTVFQRKQYFIKNDKIVFDCSDEYHKPYFETLQKILPIKKRFSLSFVAHHMLFSKQHLQLMKKEIEKTTKLEWWKAILNNLNQKELSSFSEYETYGNYMFQNNRKKILLREWYNLSTTSIAISNFSKKELNKYKTISFHSYNEE